MSIHTNDILNAYDAFHGDDVGTFTAAWDEYLAGTDTPCTAAPDGLHEVTAGSCDLCGSKNRNDDSPLSEMFPGTRAALDALTIRNTAPDCQCSDSFTASLTGHGHACPLYDQED